MREVSVWWCRTLSSVKQRPIQILVVDDDEQLLALLCSFLRDSGYDVECVETGARALERIESNRFDLLVLDVNLPEMDGKEVLRFPRDAGHGAEG